jgi:hypothetical protein
MEVGSRHQVEYQNVLLDSCTAIVGSASHYAFCFVFGSLGVYTVPRISREVYVHQLVQALENQGPRVEEI